MTPNLQRTVFYSWQSDRLNRTNRGFIMDALERAATRPAEVRRVVAHRCREPDGPGTVRTRPRIADQPLAGPESLKNVRTTTGERLLIRGEIRLPLTASLDLQPVGVRPLRNDQQG